MLSLLLPKKKDEFRAYINEVINGFGSYESSIEWAYECRKKKLSISDIIESISQEITKSIARNGYPLIALIDVFLKEGSEDFSSAILSTSFMEKLKDYILLKETSSTKINNFKGYNENLNEYLDIDPTEPKQALSKNELEIILSCWKKCLKKHPSFFILNQWCNFMKTNYDINSDLKISDAVLSDYKPKSYTSLPVWKNDTCCYICKSRFFHIVGQRHHCRNCGNSVCHTCSPNLAPLPKYLVSTPVRICNLCVTKCGETDIFETDPNFAGDDLMKKAAELSLASQKEEKIINTEYKEKEDIDLAIAISISESQEKSIADSKWTPKSRTIQSSNLKPASIYPSIPLPSKSNHIYEEIKISKTNNQYEKDLDYSLKNEPVNRINYSREKIAPEYSLSSYDKKMPIRNVKYEEEEEEENYNRNKHSRQRGYSNSQRSNTDPNFDKSYAKVQPSQSVSLPGVIESFSESVETLKKRIDTSEDVAHDQTISAIMRFIWSQHPQFMKIIEENAQKLINYERVSKKFSLLNDIRKKYDAVKYQHQEYEDQLMKEQALLHSLQTQEKLSMLRKQQQTMKEYGDKLHSQLLENTGNMIQTAILPNMDTFKQQPQQSYSEFQEYQLEVNPIRPTMNFEQSYSETELPKHYFNTQQTLPWSSKDNFPQQQHQPNYSGYSHHQNIQKQFINPESRPVYNRPHISTQQMIANQDYKTHAPPSHIYHNPSDNQMKHHQNINYTNQMRIPISTPSQSIQDPRYSDVPIVDRSGMNRDIINSRNYDKADYNTNNSILSQQAKNSNILIPTFTSNIPQETQSLPSNLHSQPARSLQENSYILTKQQFVPQRVFSPHPNLTTSLNPVQHRSEDQKIENKGNIFVNTARSSSVVSPQTNNNVPNIVISTSRNVDHADSDSNDQLITPSSPNLEEAQYLPYISADIVTQVPIEEVAVVNELCQEIQLQSPENLDSVSILESQTKEDVHISTVDEYLDNLPSVASKICLESQILSHEDSRKIMKTQSYGDTELELPSAPPAQLVINTETHSSSHEFSKAEFPEPQCS